MKKTGRQITGLALCGILLGSSIASADDDGKAGTGPLGFGVNPDFDCLPESEALGVSVFNRGRREVRLDIACQPGVEPGEGNAKVPAGEGRTILDGGVLTLGNAYCAITVSEDSPSRRADIVVTVEVYGCGDNASRAFSLSGTVKRVRSGHDDD